MTTGTWMQLGVGAGTNAAIYSLIALSLVLLYRGSGVVNFGVGYLAVFAGILFAHGSGNPWLTLIVAVLVGALLGAIAYVVAIIMAERAGASPAMLAISTLGFGMIVDYFAGVFWEKQGFTADPLWAGSFEIAGTTITFQRALTVIVAGLCFVAITLLLERTMLGWALEAVSFRRTTAEAYGVNSSAALLVVWVLAGMLAGLAGSLLGSVSAVSRPLALQLTVMGFAAAVVGGFGRVGGAVLGAITVAVTQAVFIQFVSTSYATAFAFVLLFAALAFRPEGLLGLTRSAART
jgi:branched-chain amino acid transport system permease protein